LPEFGQNEIEKMIVNTLQKQLGIDGLIGSRLADVGRDITRLEARIDQLAEDLENHVKVHH